MKKQTQNVLTILVILVIISAVIILFYLTTTPAKLNSSISQVAPTDINNSPQGKTYISKNLKFKIKAPIGYQLEEKFTTVILKNNKGEIIIDRSGTNYGKIEDYLIFFDQQRNIKIEQEDKLNINGLKSVRRLEYFTTGQKEEHKIYFIYKEYAIYKISTKFRNLFDDLDIIAQSFEYISQ
ncbi:MAG: hypothetical protein ACD_46C00286G0002 [uncultured bacterium]|nr:MAG: hypothetical protein ACD_46C00286G0002 [uncultured bacterium]